MRPDICGFRGGLHGVSEPVVVGVDGLLVTRVLGIDMGAPGGMVAGEEPEIGGAVVGAVAECLTYVTGGTAVACAVAASVWVIWVGGVGGARVGLVGGWLC